MPPQVNLSNISQRDSSSPFSSAFLKQIKGLLMVLQGKLIIALREVKSSDIYQAASYQSGGLQFIGNRQTFLKIFIRLYVVTLILVGHSCFADCAMHLSLVAYLAIKLVSIEVTIYCIRVVAHDHEYLCDQLGYECLRRFVIGLLEDFQALMLKFQRC